MLSIVEFLCRAFDVGVVCDRYRNAFFGGNLRHDLARAYKGKLSLGTKEVRRIKSLFPLGVERNVHFECNINILIIGDKRIPSPLHLCRLFALGEMCWKRRECRLRTLGIHASFF